MKTRRSFFTEQSVAKTEQSVAKKARVEEKLALDILPAEIWKEVLQYLNKKELRDVGMVCPSLYPITQDLFLDAPWPAIDYGKYQPQKSSHVYFKEQAPDTLFHDARDEYFFALQNGDAAVGLEDGRLIVLKLRESRWQLFGRHERKPFDGRMRGFRAKDVIALNSVELVSCAEDGIRIWDRISATQKQHFILSHVGSWASRPNHLLRLSNHRFMSGSWDGSLNIWRQSPDKTYQHERTLSLGDDKESHDLKKLMLINNEIVGEYSQFIARWNAKGELISRIEFADLKKRLASCLPDGDSINRMFLGFDWSFPAGYVGVKVGCHFLLVNILDNTIQPCYIINVFGYVGHKVTTKEDIVFLCNTVSQGMHIKTGWNAAKNEFAISRNIPLDHGNYLIMSNGCLLRKIENNTINLFDLHSGESRDLILKSPKFESALTTGWDDLRIKQQLHNGDLLTMYGALVLIFDLQNGECKSQIKIQDWDIKELPNGDLVNQRHEFGVYPDYTYPEFAKGTNTDHVETFRFGLRNS